MEFIANDFNIIYKMLLNELNSNGVKTKNRKGDTLTALKNVMFTLTDPDKSLAICRNLSMTYLDKEFKFYLSGSNRLEDAINCSKFWKNCTDDGLTINSNYGKLLLHDRNSKGYTQFEHAVNCIKNSYHSKKAVMTLYNNENAYISNDNPCTMFLQAMVENDKLHLTAHMRSSDVFYGLPYDVPFFVFIQSAMLAILKEYYPKLEMGSYSHISGSLHSYERNASALLEARLNKSNFRQVAIKIAYSKLQETMLAGAKTLRKIVDTHKWMNAAWTASKQSECLKKKVGCVIVETDKYGDEVFAAFGYGGVAEHREPCTTCVRDDKSDNWYGDECPSIHSEMRAIVKLLQERPDFDFSKATIYLTHGPCDACCKLMDMVGLRHIVYDIPYKTNYRHWPALRVSNIMGELQ